MRIQVQQHNCEISEALKEHATGKLEKLDRFFNNIQTVEVMFDMTQKSGADKPREVEIKVSLSGDFLKANSSSHDFRSSFNDAYKKIERRVRKHKEKVVDHSHGDHKHNPESAAEAIGELEEREQEG